MLFSKLAIIPIAIAVNEMDFLSIAERFGVLGVLCLFLMWQSYKEKKDLVSRIRTLEKEERELTERAYKAIDKLTAVLEKRACMLSEGEFEKLCERLTDRMARLFVGLAESRKS